jgi:pimeloyl-ACP methyl ester carboxylesterase
MPQAAGMYYSSFEGNPSRLTVVLIHGAGSNHLVWPADIRRLGECRVLALDLPGHGKSSGVAHQSIERYARCVLDFLSELGIYRAVLVGHSMGGAIALNVNRLASERVLGMGLLACAATFNIDDELLHLLANPSAYAQALQWLEPRLISPSARYPLTRQVMEAFRSARPGVVYADFLACTCFDMQKSVSRMRKPAWVAAGADDRLVPAAKSIALARSMTNASCDIIPSSGHMFILENPAAVRQGLERFLARLSDRAASSQVDDQPSP